MVGVIPLVNSDNHREEKGDEGERREGEEEEMERWRTDDSRDEERATLSAAQTLSELAAAAFTIKASLKISFANTNFYFILMLGISFIILNCLI